MVTQFWLAATAVALCAVTAFGLMTAVPLLVIHAVIQTKTTELIDSLEATSDYRQRRSAVAAFNAGNFRVEIVVGEGEFWVDFCRLAVGCGGLAGAAGRAVDEQRRGQPDSGARGRNC